MTGNRTPLQHDSSHSDMTPPTADPSPTASPELGLRHTGNWSHVPVSTETRLIALPSAAVRSRSWWVHTKPQILLLKNRTVLDRSGS
ncbi:unnamed protein product [Merluccius merluccius]